MSTFNNFDILIIDIQAINIHNILFFCKDNEFSEIRAIVS